MHRNALPFALILFAGCGPTAKEQAADAFAEAQLFHNEGDLDKAIAGYGLAIDLDPHNAVVYVHRAEILLMTGDPDGALADCTEAIRLDPDMADAYKGRAAVLVVLSDFEAALADFDKAIELDPTDAVAYRVRQFLHRGGDKRAKAAADWASAMKLEHPDHLTGKVVAVADGDTLTILVDQKEVKVRVHGIDCPEDGQPFGTKAKQFTADRTFGGFVSVKAIDTDRYGRTIGRVILPGDVDLSALLVEDGMAWHYVQYAPDDEKLAALEVAARQDKLGLWSDSKPPIPPWEWREGERGETEAELGPDPE